MERLCDSPVAIIAEALPDQELLAQLLDSAGYNFIVMASADDIQSSSATPYASILCIRQLEAVTRTITVPPLLRSQRVLVCSNSKSEDVIVSALESGAHHFINIDESPRVLQARIAAALRLHSPPTKKDLIIEPFHFNVERRIVRLWGEVVNLSPKEYEFAHYLFANRNRIVSNSELMTSVWSLPSSMDARRIDTAACRVRKKMQLDERTGWSLRRLRCVGYELNFTTENQLVAS
ncbi:MAG: winged helix-turn-helix domain-containing protein [Gammaproteobacteria bacterium]|nr:winged helix-turn-helix domain-containing protein [Gammaproteobacteria bacterium]